MSAVVAEGLTKRYGRVEALRGLDLAVDAGTVVALLGPNGAGKTTTVQILSTLTRPDGGSARIEGFDVVREAHQVRSRIGLTGQYAAVDERLTGRENLEHLGRLLHLGRGPSRRRAAELLAEFQLDDVAGRAAGGYSGGLRRRLDIAMSLVGRPTVLFLDEPTTGLDPRSRQGVWDLVERLARDGTTIVLTSQYLDEADRLADQVAVVDHGRVIASGTPRELKEQVGGQHVVVHVAGPHQLAAVAEALRGRGRDEPRIDPANLTVALPVSGLVGALPAVVRAVDEAGIEIVDVSTTDATLDDVFFGLTGHVADLGASEEAVGT